MDLAYIWIGCKPKNGTLMYQKLWDRILLFLKLLDMREVDISLGLCYCDYFLVQGNKVNDLKILRNLDAFQ